MKFEIKKGKIKSAIRLVAYGSEGIGKSTFASQFPDPLFIDVEGGTKQLDIARFPQPETWNDILAMVDAVIAEPTICQTLVIDTIDRAESMLSAQLLAESGVDSIEKYGGGYGKGYTAIQERFNKDLLMRLDRLIAKGVNVVLLAHAAMRKLESPDDPPYDRWELKVSKKVAPVVKEWADILIFMNYEVMVIEENGRAKAKGQAKRRMHANHKPTYDAKNRYGLPDDMELSFEPLRAVYEGTVPIRKEKTELRTDTPTDIPVEGDIREDIRDVLIREVERNGVSREEFEEWLLRTARIHDGETVMNLSTTSARAMVNHIDKLMKQLRGE